ncbi:hypothetical protein, partial [Microbispora sp. ATCC PTA-5024]|uniref:hypothetical protein n=1 Tax=Microbispora sp. ATCC PTA-5024 TaxID=316330 RepID=UPI000688A926
MVAAGVRAVGEGARFGAGAPQGRGEAGTLRVQGLDVGAGLGDPAGGLQGPLACRLQVGRQAARVRGERRLL